MKKMKYCCAGFEHALNNSGNDGFSIKAIREFDSLFFWLYFHSLKAGDERNIDVSKVRIKLILSERVSIKFCPWCGKKLHRYYKHIEVG